MQVSCKQAVPRGRLNGLQGEGLAARAARILQRKQTVIGEYSERFWALLDDPQAAPWPSRTGLQGLSRQRPRVASREATDGQDNGQEWQAGRERRPETGGTKNLCRAALRRPPRSES